MNELDFSFEQSPWEITLENLRGGDKLSALRFLTLLEGESEEAVEDAIQALEDRHVTLDISELPTNIETGEAALRLRQEKQLVQKGDLLGGLEKNDPLRLYLEEIRTLEPVCDPAALAAKCAAGDEKAMEKLTSGCLYRVVELAKEQAGRGVLLLDLIQEGSLGLWQAVLNWRGGDFDAHAQWWVRQYMAKLITLQARANGVGQKLRKALEDYRAADRRLLTQLGRNPTLEEIAMELHISPEDGAVIEKMLQSAQTMEKAKTQSQPKEVTPEDEQAVENTAYFQTRQRIMEMLSGLDELDAQVLTFRFGLEGGVPMSPQDTGKKLNLTPDEVVAREGAALAKLRRDG